MDGLDPTLAAALDALGGLGGPTGQADAEALARACGEVAAWAEARGAKETALQFAEAAARLQPDASLRCYVAGRLSRRLGEMERARTWLRRAIRLARLARNEIDFANAHRGYGFVLAELGHVAAAEPHFWKCVRAALRVGRKSLAGSGYHDLFVGALDRHRWDDALKLAKLAVAH